MTRILNDRVWLITAIPLALATGTARAAGSEFGGPDVLISELNIMEQFGRQGDVIAAATESTVCNAGTAPLDWFPLEDGRHPFIVNNMYRIEDGRFEQIGQSWVKHGFASAQQDACDLGCEPWPDFTRMGTGCSDTYSATTNANRSFIGPRHEIDPWTGAFSYAGSYLDVHADEIPGLGEIDHRMRLADADIDPAAHPDADYLIELYVVAHDDIDPMNSIAHEPVTILGEPGGTWTFDVDSFNTTVSPAVAAWPGALLTTIPTQPVDDGRCILASRATDNGDGTWHYEFALYNHDMDRQVRGLSVPVGADVLVTGIGFHAVASHDGQHTNDAWPWTLQDGLLTWETGTFAAHPDTNPLRWGTTYSFRFDADAPPVDAATATIALYKPGLVSLLAGTTRAPGVAACPGGIALCADVDSNGVRDDPCVWWACVDGCQGTAIPFADMGGSNGACPPDGAADANDRFHALNCFSNTDTFGTFGYPCEVNTPQAYNVDAGGTLGSCPPDGVCDGNDAFHALNAFNGATTCSCPLDAPAPGSTESDIPDRRAIPPAAPARAELHLVGKAPRVRPGGVVEIDVLLGNPLPDLRGYQLHVGIDGGERGDLELIDLAIAERMDRVFAGRSDWRAFNVTMGQMVAGLEQDGTPAAKRDYLATLTCRATEDAAGAFHVRLLHDPMNPDHRTFLFATDPTARFDIVTVPARVIVGGIRRERGR